MYHMEDIYVAMGAYQRRRCSTTQPKFCHMSPTFRRDLGLELERSELCSVRTGDPWLHATWRVEYLRNQETVYGMTVVVHPEYGQYDSIMWVGGAE